MLGPLLCTLPLALQAPPMVKQQVISVPATTRIGQPQRVIGDFPPAVRTPSHQPNLGHNLFPSSMNLAAGFAMQEEKVLTDDELAAVRALGASVHSAAEVESAAAMIHHPRVRRPMIYELSC